MKGKEIVVCIGQTGCGKSTLLTSLIFGPEALKDSFVTIVLDEKVTSDSSRKVRKLKVIDMAPGATEVFPIGHSSTKSMTFLPIFHSDE